MRLWGWGTQAERKAKGGPLGPWGGREPGRPAKGFPGGEEAPLGQESLARWVGTGGTAVTPAPSCPQLAGRPQALQLQRRTKVMATCISPSAGYSGSTNVLIVGAGWWSVLGGQGGLGRGLLTPVPRRPLRSGAAGLVCAETLRQEGFSGLHPMLPRGVRPRLQGKPRTPLSSRVQNLGKNLLELNECQMAEKIL